MLTTSAPAPCPVHCKGPGILDAKPCVFMPSMRTRHCAKNHTERRLGGKCIIISWFGGHWHEDKFWDLVQRRVSVPSVYLQLILDIVPIQTSMLRTRAADVESRGARDSRISNTCPLFGIYPYHSSLKLHPIWTRTALPVMLSSKSLS